MTQNGLRLTQTIWLIFIWLVLNLNLYFAAVGFLWGTSQCLFFNCGAIFVYFSEQILDLVPILAHEYFKEKMPVTLNGVQAAILLCMGLQNKDLTSIKVC
jgi:Possible tRNA binding domain